MRSPTTGAARPPKCASARSNGSRVRTRRACPQDRARPANGFGVARPGRPRVGMDARFRRLRDHCGGAAPFPAAARPPAPLTQPTIPPSCATRCAQSLKAELHRRQSRLSLRGRRAMRFRTSRRGGGRVARALRPRRRADPSAPSERFALQSRFQMDDQDGAERRPCLFRRQAGRSRDGLHDLQGHVPGDRGRHDVGREASAPGHAGTRAIRVLQLRLGGRHARTAHALRRQPRPRPRTLDTSARRRRRGAGALGRAGRSVPPERPGAASTTPPSSPFSTRRAKSSSSSAGRKRVRTNCSPN